MILRKIASTLLSSPILSLYCVISLFPYHLGFVNTVFCVAFLIGIRIMNLSEEDIVYPVDDPSWQVPYHDADFPNIISGLLYYFSTAVRAQLAREKAGKTLSPHLKLYQIDLDYAKGCILAKRLIEVKTKKIFLNC